jgi:general secretion pathway protein D
MRALAIFSLALVCVLSISWGTVAQESAPPKTQDGNPFDGAKKEGGAANPFPPHSIKLVQPLAEEMSLEDRLALKATFHGEGSSLKSFADVLEKTLDMSVVLAAKKLEEAAINLDTPISFHLKNVKVQTALRLILGEVGLAYVTHDNVIVITTPEDAGSQLVTRVYDCRELMKLPSPVRRVKKPQGGLGGQGGVGVAGGAGVPGSPSGAPVKKEEAGPDGGYDIEDLIESITVTVSPDSWDDVGGPGSISDFKGLVTVSQTEEIHEQLEKLLNMLHKAAGLEEKVKVSR